MSQSVSSCPVASLYVGNLSTDVTEATLFEKFSTAGQILSINVVRDSITRRSLGHAYVHFQHVKDAEKALDTMNYDIIKDRPMRIMWSHQQGSSLQKPGSNVFVKNLDKSIDNKAMYDTFSAFGNILSCKIATDEKGSKGYGFVNFETEEAARNAILKVDGMLLYGRKVSVCKFVPRKEREKMLEKMDNSFTNVYIKNFANDLDDDKLRKLFERFGTITSAKVMVDEDGRSKGFGFVCFKDPESAEQAVESMHGKELFGKTLYVCRAQKKTERLAELKRRLEHENVFFLENAQNCGVLQNNLAINTSYTRPHQ